MTTEPVYLGHANGRTEVVYGVIAKTSTGRAWVCVGKDWDDVERHMRDTKSDPRLFRVACDSKGNIAGIV